MKENTTTVSENARNAAKARWKKTPKKDRSRQMSEIAKIRWAKLKPKLTKSYTVSEDK